MTRWHVLVAIGWLTLVAPVLAASQGGEKDQLDLPQFEAVDSNDDGKLNFSEVRDEGVSRKRFKKAGIDGDGKLTKGDYRYGLKWQKGG